MTAITIADINTKGGAGKTTTTVEVAGELALLGHRVLTIGLDSHNPGLMTYFLPDDEVVEDLDPDKSSCALLQHPERDYRKATWNLDLSFDRRIANGLPRDVLTRVAAERGWRPQQGLLHVIPDCYALANVAAHLDQRAAELRMDSKSILNRALAQAKQDYDYILIDTPPDRPDMDLMLGNALAAADAVIIPMKVDRLTVSACREDVKRVNNISRMRLADGLSPLPILGILISQYLPGDEDDSLVIAKCRRASFRSHLFECMLPQDNTIRKAQFASELFQLYAPTGPVAHLLPALAQEVIRRAERIRGGIYA